VYNLLGVLVVAALSVKMHAASAQHLPSTTQGQLTEVYRAFPVYKRLDDPLRTLRGSAATWNPGQFSDDLPVPPAPRLPDWQVEQINRVIAAIPAEELARIRNQLRALGLSEQLLFNYRVVGDPTREPIENYLNGLQLRHAGFALTIPQRGNNGGSALTAFERGIHSGAFATARIRGFAAVAQIVAEDGIAALPDNGGWRLGVAPLAVSAGGQMLPPCPATETGVAFALAYAPGAFCTGFLAERSGRQVLMTARHCTVLSGVRSWDRARVVFGFQSQETESGAVFLPQDQVYRIVGLADVGEGVPLPLEDDFAALRLDRAVPPEVARPMQLERAVAAADDLLVALVGHPVGQPQSIDLAATEPRVLDRSGRDDLLLRLGTDSYRSDSGSPVISTETGRVVGILVRGGGDFVPAMSPIAGRCAAPVQVGTAESTETALSTLRFGHWDD
jgi:hypothetical protein